MTNSVFAKILAGMVDLSAEERSVLVKLEERQRSLRRGSVLQREREKISDLFILRQGMMMSYVLMGDGSRQILRFFFPGDMVALPSAIYEEAPETISTLTDCVVAQFDLPMLMAATQGHPRLGALFSVYTQIEQVATNDRLASLGRTAAKARIASLLLDMRDRLRRTDSAVGASFPLGLTQEEIGDATGLTSVHVNRMMRQLESEGMIKRSAGQVRFVNEVALVRETSYTDRYRNLSLDWLPKPRS